MEDILITLAIVSYMASLLVWLKWTRPALGADQTPISTRGSAVGAQFEDIKRAKTIGKKNAKVPVYVHLQTSLLSLTGLLLTALVIYFFIYRIRYKSGTVPGMSCPVGVNLKM